MKYQELITEQLEKSIIGCNISGKTIKSKLTKKTWVGDFNAAGMSLTTLIGCPKEVSGDFNISNNLFTSLEGCPRRVWGDFILGGGTHCNIESFDGAPEQVDGDVIWRLSANGKITSLHGIEKIFKKIGKSFYYNSPKLKSHILGLLLIEGLKKVYICEGGSIPDIINSYLPNTDGRQALMECQRELIDAGYPEYARL